MQDPLLLLNQISDELNKDLNPDKMLQRVIDLTVPHFKAATGSIMLFDENNRVSKYILQQQNLSDAQAHKIVGQVLTEGFAGWVLKHKRGDIITDTRDDDRWLTYPNQPYTARSVLAAPLIRRNRIVGILTINHDTKPNHFKKQDLKLLAAIAGQAAIALENAQLFRQTELERATLSAIINSSHDVIIVTHGNEDEILLLNPAAEEILQIAGAQWLQKPLATVTSATDIVGLIQQAAPEASIECCNGKTMTAGVINVPNVGKLTLMHDISALKALDKLKTEFVTAFTHDLSAPLSAIKSHLHVVPIDGPLTERQTEDMAAINAAVDQMRTLIKDLLELTRLENLKDFYTCDISLQETVQNSFGRFRQVASTKEIGLSVYTAPQALIIHGSPSLIARAVDNLVENALKYTRPN